MPHDSSKYASSFATQLRVCRLQLDSALPRNGPEFARALFGIMTTHALVKSLMFSCAM